MDCHKGMLLFLEHESIARGKNLKSYFIYGNSNGYSLPVRQAQLESVGTELGLKNIALTFVPSFTDQESEVYLNRIDQETTGTLIVYRNGSIIRNYFNPSPDNEIFHSLQLLIANDQQELMAPGAIH